MKRSVNEVQEKNRKNKSKEKEEVDDNIRNECGFIICGAGKEKDEAR